MEMVPGSSVDEECPRWCAQHREVSPHYWVHQGPDLIVRSDNDTPLARVNALLGTISGEDFGPQVNLDLVTTNVVETEGNHTYAQASLSPGEAQRLAAALAQTASTLDGFPRP